jgi:hypothetical protein
MWPAAKTGFLALTPLLEGYTNFMYLDTKGLVTTGIGNLIDVGGAPGGAVSPFEMQWRRRSDNGLASREEIQAEWDMVKSHQEMAPLGGFAGNRKLAEIGSPTQLYLDDAAMQHVIDVAVPKFEGPQRARFANWDAWPSDAQVGTMLIAWAYGPGFSNQSTGFKSQGIVDALKANAFATAASFLPSTQLSGDRNAAIMTLFGNADVAQVNQLAPELLYYPKNLVRGDDPTGGGGPITKGRKPAPYTPPTPGNATPYVPPTPGNVPQGPQSTSALAPTLAALTVMGTATWWFLRRKV